MHCKLALLLMLSVYCSILSAQSQNKHYRVHFKVDEYQLDDADRTMLNELIREYRQNRYCEINVSAHTDADAGDAYNMKLSQNRAQSVIAYLTQNGVNSKLIASGWYGERKPDASNGSEEGKSENRRVDLQMRIYNFNTVGELLQRVAPPSVQTFTVSTTQESKIVGKDGTILTIPKDALQTKDGKPVTSDNITIELQEFLKPSDAAFHQLSTVCWGRLLESGGMFTIKAMADGQELELRKGKQLDVELPSKAIQPGMELFTAVKTPEGITEWKATSQSFVANRTAPQKRVAYPKGIDTAYLHSLLVKPDFADFEKIQFTYKIPSFPVAPRKPYKPRKYEEPTAEKMYSWVARLVLPASYIERKVSEEHDRLEQKYQTRMARYEPKQQKYLVEYAKYQRDSAMFEEEHGGVFHAWLMEQKTYNENFIDAAEQYNFNRKIMKLIAMNDSNAWTAIMEQDKWLDKSNRMAATAFKSRFALNYITLIQDWTLSEVIAFNSREFTATRRELSLLKIPGNKDRKPCIPQYVNAGQIVNNYALNDLFASIQRDVVARRAKAGIIDNETVNQVYATSLSSFGSFNCDRFSDQPPARMANIRVNYPGDARVSFYIPSLNGYIYGYKDANGYAINLPKNTTVKVVCVAFSETQGLLCSVQEVKFKANGIVDPDLKNVKLDEMNRMLAGL